MRCAVRECVCAFVSISFRWRRQRRPNRKHHVLRSSFFPFWSVGGVPVVRCIRKMKKRESKCAIWATQIDQFNHNGELAKYREHNQHRISANRSRTAYGRRYTDRPTANIVVIFISLSFAINLPLWMLIHRLNECAAQIFICNNNNKCLIFHIVRASDRARWSQAQQWFAQFFFSSFRFKLSISSHVNWIDADGDPARSPSLIHKNNVVFDAQTQWQQVNNTRANLHNGHERLIVQFYVNEPELVLSEHLF